MALSYTSVKDDVCRAVFSVDYTDLDAYQKSIVDRFGGDAETRLGQYAVFWQMDSSAATEAPASWEAWLVMHAAMVTAAVVKRDRYDGLKEAERMAADAALNLFTSSDAKTGVPTDQDPASLTVRMIYKYVLMHCIKRTPRLFPNVDTIDAAIHWAVNTLWSRKNWKFREIAVTLSFDSTGYAGMSPSISLGNVLATASTRFYSVETFQEVLVWATADQMARLKANFSTETGRPRYFRFDHADSTATVSWTIWPLPAVGETWTFKGMFLKSPPAAPTLNNSTTDFGQWPSPFKPVLKELILAKVMEMHGHPDGSKMMNGVEAEIALLVPQYVEVGEATQPVEVLDIYGDTSWVTM